MSGKPIDQDFLKRILRNTLKKAGGSADDPLPEQRIPKDPRDVEWGRVTKTDRPGYAGYEQEVTGNVQWGKGEKKTGEGKEEIPETKHEQHLADPF